MTYFNFTSAIRDWLRGALRSEQNSAPIRGVRTHVIILDGTMSSLEQGMETNAGRTYRILCKSTPEMSLFYEAGLQFVQWKNATDILMGRGINRQIRRAYGFLASRYRPGDQIFLFGYSRGAYAVRSLGGLIDSIGLLTASHATERNIRQAYRHYRAAPESEIAQEFAHSFCHPEVKIEMIGVWDTVKALGLRWPIVRGWGKQPHEFHNHKLGPSISNGFQALARDETRVAYAPVMWESANASPGRLEQLWFRGNHGDVGGHIGGRDAVRPLSNIPLVWMLERAEECGLALHPEWHRDLAQDVFAASTGAWSGWNKLFLNRRRRKIGKDPSERLHETVLEYERLRKSKGIWRSFGFRSGSGLHDNAGG